MIKLQNIKWSRWQREGTYEGLVQYAGGEFAIFMHTHDNTPTAKVLRYSRVYDGRCDSLMPNETDTELVWITKPDTAPDAAQIESEWYRLQRLVQNESHLRCAIRWLRLYPRAVITTHTGSEPAQ